MFKDESTVRESQVSEVDGNSGGFHDPDSPAPCDRASPCERGSSANALEAFQLAWLRATALVWKDPNNLELLKSDPRRFLRTSCEYDLPRNVELTVCASQQVPPAGRRWGWDARHGIWSLPRAQVTLYIPPPPELAEQAVALAELGDPDKLPPLCC
ncbi:BMA_0021/BMA_0022 family TOMM bacteriocin [Sorangium sp. So ce887]|uniref:BMA_0021/BMA_0022 family TOMM bacteriocin n=1 Tax=Sorangium sp. So ce887 TaxID=3133324 RepID=UPI003F5E96E6